MYIYMTYPFLFPDNLGSANVKYKNIFKGKSWRNRTGVGQVIEMFVET